MQPLGYEPSFWTASGGTRREVQAAPVPMGIWGGSLKNWLTRRKSNTMWRRPFFFLTKKIPTRPWLRRTGVSNPPRHKSSTKLRKALFECLSLESDWQPVSHEFSKIAPCSDSGRRSSDFQSSSILRGSPRSRSTIGTGTAPQQGMETLSMLNEARLPTELSSAVSYPTKFPRSPEASSTDGSLPRWTLWRWRRASSRSAVGTSLALSANPASQLMLCTDALISDARAWAYPNLFSRSLIPHSRVNTPMPWRPTISQHSFDRIFKCSPRHRGTETCVETPPAKTRT